MNEYKENMDENGTKEILYGKVKLRNHGLIETTVYYSIFIFYIVFYGFYQTSKYSEGNYYR